MDIASFILILIALQIVCLVVGGRSSKGIKTQEDYFLAGKKIRFFPLMMTFLATQLGGGVILGAAEEAYQFGWTVLLYPLGGTLGLLLLGSGVGRRLSQMNVSTIAQIFETVYKSTTLKKIASMLSMLTLFMIFAAQIVGSKKFMMSLGIESQWLFIFFWAVVIIYTVVGGLKAVVSTDLVQAAFFVTIFLLTFGYVGYFSEVSPRQVFEMGWNTETFAFDSSKLIGWILLPLLFMVIEQGMGQRCFAADCSKTVSKATIGAAIGSLIIGVIPVFLGIFGKGLGIIPPKGASILMMTIMQTTTPLITAFVGCAVLAAIISTADSLINAISSNLSQDFEGIFNNKNVRVSQGLSILIALGGIFFSFFFDNIVDMLILSYEFSLSCLFIPIFIGLFKKEGNMLSAALAIACGAAAFTIFKIVPIPFPKEVMSILISLLGFGVGELIIKFREGVKKLESV